MIFEVKMKSVNTEIIFSVVLYLTIALFVIMNIAMLYSVFRSRRQRLPDDGEKGPRAWEGVWSAIPAVILLALLVLVLMT